MLDYKSTQSCSKSTVNTKKPHVLSVLLRRFSSLHYYLSKDSNLASANAQSRFCDGFRFRLADSQRFLLKSSFWIWCNQSIQPLIAKGYRHLSNLVRLAFCFKRSNWALPLRRQVIAQRTESLFQSCTVCRLPENAAMAGIQFKEDWKEWLLRFNWYCSATRKESVGS